MLQLVEHPLLPYRWLPCRSCQPEAKRCQQTARSQIESMCAPHIL